MTCVELGFCLSSVIFFFVGIMAGWQKWHNGFAALGSGVVGVFAGLLIVMVIIWIIGGIIFIVAKIRGDEDFFRDVEVVPSEEKAVINPDDKNV